MKKNKIITFFLITAVTLLFLFSAWPKLNDYAGSPELRLQYQKQADTIAVIACINSSDKTDQSCDSCWDIFDKKQK